MQLGRDRGIIKVGRIGCSLADGSPGRTSPPDRRPAQSSGSVSCNAAIATALVITETAVARHASQIYDALGLAPSLDDHRRVLAVIRLLNS